MGHADVRLRRLALGLARGTALATSIPPATLSAQSDAVRTYGSVTAVPATGLISKPANLFDLEGTTVTFTPDGADGYTVAVGGLTWEDPGSAPARAFSEPARTRPSPFDDRRPLMTTSDVGHEDSLVDLPFAFPFAGRTWTRVYANVNGNISFEQSEAMLWRERNPWPGGTMRSVAAAVDLRSAVGLEAMIAVLWALYGEEGETTIFVEATPDRTVITWQAARPTPTDIYYEPLGENSFQARLYPSGAIELAYRAVAERDGIVGLFHGLGKRGRTLDTVDAAVGNVALGVLDITRFELVDNGSMVLARMTLADDVPERVTEGTIEYRIFLSFGNTECLAGVSITADGRAPLGWCGGDAPPHVSVYRVRGATLEIPISKTALNGTQELSWTADAVWWGTHQFDYLFEPRTVRVGDADYDVSAMAGALAGNVFEVFHYASIPKGIAGVMSFIYDRAPADDEFALPMTDFRVDDLFNTGGATGGINVPIHGIGDAYAYPSEGESYGSSTLLTATEPVFIGGPNFAETGISWGRPFRNFGHGIRWVGHELVHRWTAGLQFRSPRSGRIEDVREDGGCRCHWNEWLHVPAVHPVWPRYASQRYFEASIMGGGLWRDNGDGTFTREKYGDPLPTGLSALDLYAMGMIPPSEVPETFLLRDVQETGVWNRVRGTKVPVRINDIMAALGPRVPAAEASRKEFRLGIFLLHEGGRPPRMDLVERAQGLTRASAEYFAAATGGRMRVVPTLDPTANLSPVPVGTLGPLTLPAGVAVQVDPASAFRDPDGDPLTYAVTSSSPPVASVAVSGSTVTVTAVAPGVATITVAATDSGGGAAATRTFTVTVAVPTSFTDDPIVPRVTPVRAIHFAELRARIDALRETAELVRFGWTDSVLTAGVTPVRRVHLLELRRALTEAYAAAGRAAPGWTDPAAAAGVRPIRAVHLAELRAAVVALE